jgi:hypothetical protein
MVSAISLLQSFTFSELFQKTPPKVFFFLGNKNVSGGEQKTKLAMGWQWVDFLAGSS